MVHLRTQLLVVSALCSSFVACQGQIQGSHPVALRGGTTGANTTGGTGDGVEDGGQPLTPPSVASYVSKVKDLLVGLPATDDEIANVTANPDALEGLVTVWMTSGATAPLYKAKMIAFFENAFQQSQISANDFFMESPVTPGAALQQNIAESFARTAWELVQEGQPFNAVTTTTRFMMTPVLMDYYAYIDSRPADDTGKFTDAYSAGIDGGYSYYAESSAGLLPLSETVDPTSPNYMHFYAPALTNVDAGALPPPSACAADPRLYNSKSGSPSDNLTFLLNGVVVGEVLDGGRCPTVAQTSPYLTNSDYAGWAMVDVRGPDAGEATTRFYDLDTFRGYAAAGSGELVLNIPRVGFFTTPSFLAQWQTNASNQARVTMNQTLIVALDHAYDGTDTTTPLSTAALDSAHATPGSACLACHETLDPMRQFFRQDYSLYFHQQTDPTQQALPGSFAFEGVTANGTSIFDLGRLLGSHPRFAMAWTQKLCSYATSGPCDETDPELVRIAARFAASNFSWTTLVTEMFSSPLVTYASATQTALEAGQTFGLARRDHLCAQLSNRLGVNDVCGLDITHPSLGIESIIAQGYPSDQYARGQVAPLFANAATLFSRAGLENLCTALSTVVVDGATYHVYSSGSPTHAIQDMVSNLMGLTTGRSEAALAILEGHYQKALALENSPTNALRSTFVLACTSPYVAGMGQ